MTNTKDNDFTLKENVHGVHIYENIAGNYICNTKTHDTAMAVVKALEKQIPKKPKKILQAFEYRFGDCPSCNKSSDMNYKHCQYCGQKLDWE